MISTQYIVLSKQPYKESSLLLRGFSPDYGKLSFIVHGAQKLSTKHFPEVDIFRELSIEYQQSTNSDLHTVKNVELENTFDSIANKQRNFLMAGKISSFILNNAPTELPQPFTYDSLRSVFCNLALGGEDKEGVWSLIECAVVIKATYLYENGLLPETENEKSNDFIEMLVAAGIENSSLPSCDSSYWKTLNQWLDSLLNFHGLKK